MHTKTKQITYPGSKMDISNKKISHSQINLYKLHLSYSRKHLIVVNIRSEECGS